MPLMPTDGISMSNGGEEAVWLARLSSTVDSCCKSSRLFALCEWVDLVSKS